MKGAHGYLHFNGNCREAMHFYQRCLGGKLYFQTVAESPMAGRLPEPMQACILHASLVNDRLVLMGTDLLGEQGLQKGNNMALMIDCSSEKEMRSVYRKLSGSAAALQNLNRSDHGALFGNLEDRYGNHWLLYFNKNQH